MGRPSGRPMSVSTKSTRFEKMQFAFSRITSAPCALRARPRADKGKRAFGPPQPVEKVRQPPEGHQTHHPRDTRGMLFGFPQYPFPAKKQPILRTAHTKSAVFSVKVSGFPVHARESRRYFHCPIFSKRFIDKLGSRKSGAVFSACKGRVCSGPGGGRARRRWHDRHCRRGCFCAYPGEGDRPPDSLRFPLTRYGPAKAGPSACRKRSPEGGLFSHWRFSN